jgi:hypothetical protein
MSFIRRPAHDGQIAFALQENVRHEAKEDR